MKNYIKPSANVIELAVKETLSRAVSRERSYRIKIGNNTYRNADINTATYASVGASTVQWKTEA